MVRRLLDIAPDGLPISVNWEGMEVGTSIFVPCLDFHACRKHVREITDQFGWITIDKVRIEDQKLGLRIWRTT